MANKRIIDLQTQQALTGEEYVAIDSTDGGTKKYPVESLSDKYALYDAVLQLYHDDNSSYVQNGWEINILKGSYDDVVAKLESGLEPPVVLVLVKGHYFGYYGAVPGVVYYWSPWSSSPYFDVSATLFAYNHAQTNNDALTCLHLPLVWYSDNNIEVVR